MRAHQPSADRARLAAPRAEFHRLGHSEPIPCAEGVENYRAGLDRNEEYALSHTYAMMADGELWPMCGYGWNRAGGHRFSILRQVPGSEGKCKLCRKNVVAGKPPVMDGFPHKTRWL